MAAAGGHSECAAMLLAAGARRDRLACRGGDGFVTPMDVAEAGGHDQCALLVKRSHIDEQGLKLEMGDGSCGRDWLFAFMRNAGRCGPPIAPLPPHGMPPLATSLSALLICSLPPSHVVDDARAGVIGLSAPRRPRSSLCSWLVGA